MSLPCMRHADNPAAARSSHYVYVHFFLVFVASWLRLFAECGSVLVHLYLEWVGWVIRRHTCSFTRQQLLQALQAASGLHSMDPHPL